MNKIYYIIIACIVVLLAGTLVYFGVFGADRLTPDPKVETIQLYYYNPAKDTDSAGNILCSSLGLVAVERQISQSNTFVQDVIEELLSGQLTSVEKDRGIATEFPLSGFRLEGVLLDNGELTLTFSDSQNRTVGGACRVGILWMQIEATAKQFPEVKEVRFQPEELF